MSWSFLCSGSSVKIMDDCFFVDVAVFLEERPRHLQNEQSSIILTELPEHKKDHDIYKTNNHLSCSVKMMDDSLFCRCRGVSCVQGVRMKDDCLFCRCRGHCCVQGVHQSS
jgi:hypothetical protein